MEFHTGSTGSQHLENYHKHSNLAKLHKHEAENHKHTGNHVAARASKAYADYHQSVADSAMRNFRAAGK